MRTIGDLNKKNAVSPAKSSLTAITVKLLNAHLRNMGQVLFELPIGSLSEQYCVAARRGACGRNQIRINK